MHDNAKTPGKVCQSRAKRYLDDAVLTRSWLRGTQQTISCAIGFVEMRYRRMTDTQKINESDDRGSRDFWDPNDTLWLIYSIVIREKRRDVM